MWRRRQQRRVEGGRPQTGDVQVVEPARAATIIDRSDPRLRLVDVRTPAEFAEAHIGGAELIDIQAADFESGSVPSTATASTSSTADRATAASEHGT